nr:30S ribosomal protein S8 [uncultured archaeon]
MSHDIVADALSIMKNAKKAKKDKVKISRISGLLIQVLKIMKQKEAINSYKIDSKGKIIEINLGDFIECKSIKPRFTAKISELDRYIRRYLPARGIGTVIISTNKGLLTHEEALEENVGGSLIAYFY